MIFNSLIFIFMFFPIFWILSLLSPKASRKLIIIFLSLLFYAWANINNLIILIILIIFNYLICRNYNREKIKKKLLLLGILMNIGFLFYYKYFIFFSSLFDSNLVVSIIAPLGISFFVFSCISFQYDVYKGYAKLCSFIDFIFYISIFTKIISGPILLYRNFSSSMCIKNKLELQYVKGLERFIIGLSKKTLVADTLGVLVDNIFNSLPMGIDTLTAWIGAFAYTLQIYYDFSGYSDMAIGLSKMFGLMLPENFNFPYISKSITEFWRRWHITLGDWFKNYIYIPLGGNKSGNVYVNLFVVFLITGIWHGANWTFILWGIGYGFIRIIEKKLFKMNLYNKIPDLLKWGGTFLIVMLFWVLFRSESIAKAIDYISRMFCLNKPQYIEFTYQYYVTLKYLIVLCIAFIGSTLFSKDIIKSNYETLMKNNFLYLTKYIVLIMLMVFCIIMIINSRYSPNIYFQF